MFGDALHVSFAENPADAEWQRWQSETGGNLSGWHTENCPSKTYFSDLINQQNLTKSAAI
ncbi:MAG: hypothetical protein R3C26_09000 [Calditrichia bacterium]